MITCIPVWHNSSYVATNRFPPAPSVSPPPPSSSSAPQEWFHPNCDDYAQSRCLFPPLPSWKSWPPAQVRQTTGNVNLFKNKMQQTPILFYLIAWIDFTLNWDSSSSPTVEGPGSFSLVSARLRISSMSISYRAQQSMTSLYFRKKKCDSVHTIHYRSTYLRLLLFTLWLFEKLLSTKLQNGRQLLLVEWCRTACNKAY